MKIPDKLYDLLKWLLLIVVPAFEVCLNAMAAAWHWDIPLEAINISISAIATFIGVCIGISTTAYNADDRRKDIVDKIEEEL